MIYTVRTTSGREDIVIDMMETKIKNESIDIKAVVHPAEIKGYVFVESTLANVHKAVQGLMHVRGIIEKPIKLEEIQRFLEYKKTRITIDMGDVVEIVGGSFKSEKGKVIRIDKVKGEVTIELLEASIPIPVTTAIEFVKVIKRAKPEKTEKPKEPKPKREETLGTELEEELEKEAEEIKEEPEGEEPTIPEEVEEEAERELEEEAKEEETVSEEEPEKQEVGEETEKETQTQEEEPEKKQEEAEHTPKKNEPKEAEVEQSEEDKTILEELEELSRKKKKPAIEDE